jgi:hypothetical protein
MTGISLVNVFLGTCLSFSPWLLSFSSRSASSATVAVGLAVSVLAFASVAAPTYRAFAFLNAMVGASLFVSPWVLGYTNEPVAMWNAVIFGGFVLLFALARAVVPVPAGYGEGLPFD